MNKVRNTSIFFVFIILLLVSAYGRNIPNGLEMYKKVGRYLIRPYPYGVFISQVGIPVYYNISPYDFYYPTPETEAQESTESSETIKRRNVLSYGNEIRSEESQPTANFLHRLKKLFYTINSYFGLQDVSATFNSSQKTFSLETRSDQGLISVSAKSTGTDDKNFVSTLSFNEEDIIFDDKGNLYNSANSEFIEKVNSEFNFTLNPIFSSDSYVYIPNGVNNLYISNSGASGVVKIPLNNPQIQIKRIDIKRRLVEFNRPNNINDSVIKFSLLDDLNQAYEGL